MEPCWLGTQVLEAVENKAFVEQEYIEILSDHYKTIDFIINKMTTKDQKKLLSELGIKFDEFEIFTKVYMKL